MSNRIAPVAVALFVFMQPGPIARISGAQSQPDKSQTADQPTSVSIKPLAPGIWLHTSTRTVGGSRLPSHGLIVSDDRRVYLVDTGWGVEPTRTILEWIATELRLPVAGAVITHFHNDRLGGSPELAKRNIPFHGLALTRTLAGNTGLPLPEAFEDLERTPARLGPLEIFYPGPAHTRDNIVIWIEKARVLFGGCAVRPLESSSAGNTADADVANWPDAIRRVQARYPNAAVVVPSHGAPNGPELLAHTIEVLSERSRSRQEDGAVRQIQSSRSR